MMGEFGRWGESYEMWEIFLISSGTVSVSGRTRAALSYLERDILQQKSDYQHSFKDWAVWT
jgi:hypothetical protein